MAVRASIIATTYNQADDLDLYLRSLRTQSCAEFEILVADDGSGPDTAEIVFRHQREFFGTDRLRHVWHPDVGYRKSKVLNRAIHQASANWLIFTDSDLLVHPRFVDDHLAYRAPNTLFMGRRVDLGKAVSGWIRANPARIFGAEFYLRVLRSAFESDTPSVGVRRTFRVGFAPLARALRNFRVPDLLGSNFSIDRDLLFRVNGFDEAREYYWGEDGDLFVRARNAGARIVGRKQFAVELHLWHVRRSPKPDAEALYARQLLDHEYLRCANGLAETER